MPLVCKGQCKNWCLVLRTVAFLVARLGSRQSQCRRERGWVFMGSGVWVHSGVYTFPGVFYELLEVRMICFQELLSCMGYIHLGHYSFILNVCSWCVISRRISNDACTLGITYEERRSRWMVLCHNKRCLHHALKLSIVFLQCRKLFTPYLFCVPDKNIIFLRIKCLIRLLRKYMYLILLIIFCIYPEFWRFKRY